jgi:hypothetical protein
MAAPSDPTLKPIEAAPEPSDAPAIVDDAPVPEPSPEAPQDQAPPRPEADVGETLDALVEQVGSRVWERMANHVAALLSQATADARAEAERSAAELRAEVARVQAGDDRPTVRFIAAKGWQPFPPRPAEDGTIILYHTANPEDGTSTEVSVPSAGQKVVDLGYRVELPPGWIADVTVEGVAGQRFQVALLSGASAPHGSLKLAIRTNNPHAGRVSAGSELARLHLRRAAPAEVVFVDHRGHESKV